MLRFTILILFVMGCADHQSTSNQPLIQGDACAAYVDEENCLADGDCTWFALGRPCPDDGSYCQSGVCQALDSGGGGGGSTETGCVCPDDGVCFEQIGGPAQTGGAQIECITPSPGDGDPCGRIDGQGTCTESAEVSGLCICDNGVR